MNKIQRPSTTSPIWPAKRRLHRVLLSHEKELGRKPLPHGARFAVYEETISYSRSSFPDTTYK